MSYVVNHKEIIAIYVIYNTLFIVCCIFNCRYASECFPVAYRPGRGSEILTQDLWTRPSEQHLKTASFLYRVPGLCLQILKNQEYDIFTIEHPTARIKRSSSAVCLFTGPSCPWSPVYVSQCLSLSTFKTLLRLCWCDWWFSKIALWGRSLNVFVIVFLIVFLLEVMFSQMSQRSLLIQWVNDRVTYRAVFRLCLDSGHLKTKYFTNSKSQNMFIIYPLYLFKRRTIKKYIFYMFSNLN